MKKSEAVEIAAKYVSIKKSWTIKKITETLRQEGFLVTATFIETECSAK